MYPYQNPVNDFYMRNAQQYGQQLLPFPPQQPQIPQVNTRFVTNIEEARAAMIDGVSTNLFLDSGTGKIYLKKMNNNGLSDFLVYSIEQSKEEKKDPIEEINSRLSNIENALGGIINAKSVSNAQSNGYVATAVAEQNESNAEAESTGFPKNARNDKWKKWSRHEADCYELSERERNWFE